MNIIQEKIRSVHVFTPPATLGKQRNNFVSRDNFGPYCKREEQKRENCRNCCTQNTLIFNFRPLDSELCEL